MNKSTTNLKPYNSKEITIFRAKRSAGDGEESASSSQIGNNDTSISYTGTSTHFNDQDTKDTLQFQLMPEASIPFFSHPNLSYVSNIAQKLNKVSLFTAPDHILLSSPPLEFAHKTKILLHPTEKCIPKRNNSSVKRKEPKFIPYEPYRGCIKPILGSQKKKSKVKDKMAIETQPKLSNCDVLSSTSENNGSTVINDQEKFNFIIVDFEKEKREWETENSNLKSENQDLGKLLAQQEKEVHQLQQQLSVQSQVNTELKKLLVASVGEDVQGRVQCLTEDKARMATMIRKYSEKVDKDYEEKERISIQCDVYRSKFLASSLLIDELARWKGTLFQSFQEAQDALKVLLQEKEIVHHSLVNCYKYIHQVQEAFDPLHTEFGGIGIIDSTDVVSLSVALSGMGEALGDRLLGSLGRAVGNTDLHLPEETRTPGEKMALKVLETTINPDTAMLTCSGGSPTRGSLISRFHPNTRTENLTVNCCGHCSGDIKVI